MTRIALAKTILAQGWWYLWPRGLWRDWRRLLPAGLLMLALTILRAQLARELDYGPVDAVRFGAISGLFRDGLALAVAMLVGTGLWALTGLRRPLGWSLGAVLVFVASAANVLHFRFFGMPLDWWIVRLHWRDLLLVKGSALQLADSALVAVASLTLVLAIGVANLLPPLTQLPQAPTESGGELTRRRWRLALRLGVAGLLIATFAWRVPIWLGFHGGTRPLNDSVLRIWLEQNFRDGLYSGVGADWSERLGPGGGVQDAARLLVEYRDAESGASMQGASGDHSETPWPLLQTFSVSPELVRSRREMLGLPTERPPHVVVLFLESVRAFELLHPELGPLVFPRLRALLERHAIVYRQAYSSSIIAGETVRGQFTALCSMLPNALGAATYIAHTTVRLHCLQEFLARAGYQTSWMNSFRKNFHGKQAFESRHGTEHFFDGQFYRQRGVHAEIGDWGLADEPFLVETVHLLEELAAGGRAQFANVLTISSHHPYSVIPEGPLPEALLLATAEHPNYQAYLSRLRYVDRAVAAFFDELFESAIGGDTLVVLLGDHGARVAPHLPLGDRQRQEVQFRVPMALVTRHMPAPRASETVVHQLDVAPTIAEVTGGEGPISWLGRSMLTERGSPWVYDGGNGVSFRTQAIGCYSLPSHKAPQCWQTDRDPMLSDNLVSTTIGLERLAWFERLLPATMRLIVFNQIVPPPAARPEL